MEKGGETSVTILNLNAQMKSSVLVLDVANAESYQCPQA